MNQVVLEKAAAAWCEVFDFAGSGCRPRTLPLKPLTEEASTCLLFIFVR